MTYRIGKGRTLILVFVVLVVGCSLYLSYKLRSSPKPQSQPELRPTPTIAPPPQTEITPMTTSYSLPVRLIIPKLDIDTAINPVGLTPEGNMEAPSDPHQVGWYKFGSLPGNVGSAVLAGHYGRSRNGELSIFDQLHTLTKGDPIYAEDENGAIATFVIREIRSYRWDENVLEVFQATDEKSHLNLITCQGAWDKSRLSYSQRLIVFADKEE